MWVDYDVRRLADNLIKVVLNAVQPDFVALQLRVPSGDSPMMIARTAGELSATEESDRILADISTLLHRKDPGF